jgi:hypothetical protein
LLFAFFVAFNAIGLVIMLTAARYPVSLYVRNALFSEVVDDGQVPDEAALNLLLARRLRRDPPALRARELFTAAELTKLDRLVADSQSASCRLPKDLPQTLLTPADCLARALAKDVSPYMTGGKCGLDGSLRARIGQVRHGVGCCSDFNEAFLLRAQAVGLEVREVNNLGHTMAEYFDPAQQRWRWIDTSNRVQVASADGVLLSGWVLRTDFPWRARQFIDLPPNTPAQARKAESYAGYLSSRNSILSWTEGLNFQQIEKLEQPLRQIGLPKELVQIVSLSLGVRPGWLVLAPSEAAFRYRLSAGILKGTLAAFVLADLLLLLVALGWRVTRNRPFCSESSTGNVPF